MSNPSSRPVALVTGGARRVGATIARTLHDAGYDLALNYRHSGADASSLLGTLEQARPGSTLAVQADLADTARLPSLIEQVLTRFGRLDALVNNASAFYPTPIGQATQAQWSDLFASNAQAPFFLVQAARPALEAAHGSIVNLVDIYAERALADYPIYVMAKAALAAMTRTLAADLGPSVRINAVAPGAVLWPAEGKDYDDRTAMLARTGTSEGSPRSTRLPIT